MSSTANNLVLAPSGGSSKNGDDDGEGFTVRTKLPVPQPDKNHVNLWSYLKHCVGKELHKITMPVQWNEPTSLLQRVSEYMNYAHLLTVAAGCPDAHTRMQWVAAFAVSALASNFQRMGKPFNPLLGETYELERNEFRILCEQVGHHPPVSAFHADGPKFVFRGSMYPKMRFWGKSVEFQPKGTLTVELPDWSETYTWTNVHVQVHNVILGSLWIEQTGTMEIVNRSTNDRCCLNFRPAGGAGGWFSSSSSSSSSSSQQADDLHTVEGFIVDGGGSGAKVKFLYGKWTEYMCAADVPSIRSVIDIPNVEKLEPNASNLPKHPALEPGAVPGSQTLWEVDERPEWSSSYYNFSYFAMGLNQSLPDGEQASLCPTDCRKRPDIRALEEGDLEAAIEEKDRLETKQRDYRKPFKNKKSESDWWTPRWFAAAKNDHTGEDDWKYSGDYWDSKSRKTYVNVPDIF